MIDTHQGTLALSYKQCLELIYLLEIPNSQRRMSVKNLERLIDKLSSMQLAVHGAIRHFYAMQVALTRI